MSCLFLFAVITKLLFLFGFVADPQLLFFDPDSEGYYNLAVNVLEHGAFSKHATPPFLPDNTRTPLYPFFLAGLFAVFGKNLTAVAVAQILVSAATVILIYLLGLELGKPKAAAVAGVLFGLDLSAVIFAHALLTETLFTLVFLAAILSLAVALRELPWRIVLLAGFLTGLASLCRPVALYFFLPAIALLVVSAGREWRRGLRASLLYLAAFGLTVAPWVVRNHQVFGVANFSGIQGVNLLLINATYLEADRLGIPVEEVDARFEREVQEVTAGRDIAEADLYQVYQRLGMRKILAHPWRYAWVHLKGIVPSLMDNNVRDLSYFRGEERPFFGARDLLVAKGPIVALRTVLGSKQRNQLLLFSAVDLFQLVLYSFAVWGAVCLWRRGDRHLLGVVVISATYLLFMTAPAGSVRFRFPAMPYIELLAGSGIVASYSWWKARYRRGSA